MISSGELVLVGKVNKTHGVDGELSVSFVIDGAYDTVDDGTCLVMNIDGINVPFFADGVRTRGAESLLVHLDGVDTQSEASAFVGLPVYMLTKDLPETEADGDEGLYAAQLVGFKAINDEDSSCLGEITDIDDSTDNPLFIITRPEGGTLLVPIADELITEISTENKTINLDLPEGLLQL